MSIFLLTIVIWTGNDKELISDIYPYILAFCSSEDSRKKLTDETSNMLHAFLPLKITASLATSTTSVKSCVLDLMGAFAIRFYEKHSNKFLNLFLKQLSSQSFTSIDGSNFYRLKDFSFKTNNNFLEFVPASSVI